MSAPVSASVYESLAGAYWAVARHECAIAKRCREAGANKLVIVHLASATEAEHRARAAEESARHLWDNPSEAA